MFSLPSFPLPSRCHWFAIVALLYAATAQAQPHAAACKNLDTGTDHIAAKIQNVASSMHWDSGLVWQRCLQGQRWDSATSQCKGISTRQPWNQWMRTAQPQSFDGQARFNLSAPAGQDRLLSSPASNSTSHALLQSIISGTAQPQDRNNLAPARWVRGGQPFADLPISATRNTTPGKTITFPPLMLRTSTDSGTAWGGIRLSGEGNPTFQINGTGPWRTQAIVSSADQIRVRIQASETAGQTHKAQLHLRSASTTGTSANGSNAGEESSHMHESVTRFAVRNTASPASLSDGRLLPLSSILGLSVWSLRKSKGH